jgi:D-alanyl-D-alanine carboxypeptidase/D-alanyl-D-alanine-endopeptidase (penicillin-binding protein 4)
MSVMTLLRRWGLAAVLGIASFLSWQAAQRRDIDDVSVEPIAYELSPATPVLSARRIPRTLQAPVVDEIIRPSIESAVEQSPETSCVLIQAGDRVLEPATNPETGLVPASNQKLLTTYAALLSLGEDFHFRTRIAVDAAPVDGVVEGNLYLIGGGDPFLSTDAWWEQYDETEGRYHTRLEDLADKIVDSGVTSITGSVIGDESLFDSQRAGPWADRLIAQKQSGPLSALTLNEGYVDWPSPFPGGSGNRSASDDPPLHAAGALTQLLQEQGVTVGTSGAPLTATGKTPSTASVLTEILSPPLIDVITHINSYSSNIGAELLLKRIGVEEAGEGSTAAGANAVRNLLTEHGIPAEQLVVDDGSGLSENNRVTCRALAAVLADAGTDSPLARSLSVGAERGSLRERFTELPPGAVQAKTGTLNSVSALSGYVESSTDSAVTLVFAYVANQDPILSNQTVKSIQDALVSSLTTYPGTPTIDVLSPRDPLPG